MFKMTRNKANIILLIVALIWGFGFVAQSAVVNLGVPAGQINFIRGLIYTAVSVIFFYKILLQSSLRDYKVGFIAGFLNFMGFLLQSIGLKYTTPSHSSFLTVTNVVMIPFIAFFFYKKKVMKKSYIAIAISMVGMAVLTEVYKASFSLNWGDVITILCAFFYAASIVYIAYSAKDVDVRVTSCMMGFVQLLGGLLYMLVFETKALGTVTAPLLGQEVPQLMLPIGWFIENWIEVVLPLFYLGFFSSFLAQSMQVFAQKYTAATDASLIMMLEGLFGAIFSVMFGFEKLTLALVVGGALIMTALFINEMDFSKFRRLTSSR